MCYLKKPGSLDFTGKIYKIGFIIAPHWSLFVCGVNFVLWGKDWGKLWGTEKMFDEIMKRIQNFLDHTPEDIYEFSILLEDALVDDYDEMHREQPRATEILANETPDICASAEPGMKPEEIEEFKRKLKKEYQKAKQAMKV